MILESNVFAENGATTGVAPDGYNAARRNPDLTATRHIATPARQNDDVPAHVWPPKEYPLALKLLNIRQCSNL